jgi:uncharacterized membrane protein YfcA
MIDRGANSTVSVLEIIGLLCAGTFGGALASIVGGASLVTFPILVASGLSPLVAATTNIVALAPGILSAAYWDRQQLPAFQGSFAALVLASLAGAAVGAMLLLATPVRVFAGLVPLLLGFATVLFAFSRQFSRMMRERAARHGRVATGGWGNTVAVLLPVSVYGGYFGAGVGVLLLGVLSIGTGGDYRAANVIKNLVTSLNSVAAAIIYIAHGAVAWPHVLIMMAGGMLGGWIGARVAQVAPRELMHIAVVVIGAGLTVLFAWRYWL